MKNIAILLSGGIGTRLGQATPKQYIEVDGKPIIAYTMEALERSPLIDGIVVVAADEWKAHVAAVAETYGISKFLSVAPAGENRQRSCLNGFLEVERLGGCDTVLVHDAVRPFVSLAVIARGVALRKDYDAVLSVIPIKDTPYLSLDGREVSGLVDRSTIYAGQTPELFDFRLYLDAMRACSDGELDAATGSAVIAFRRGLTVAIAEGEERNFKITTAEDLDRFLLEIRRGK